MRAAPKELIQYLKRFDPAIQELALNARDLILKVLAPSNESVLDVYVLAMNYGFSERMKDQVVYIGVYEKYINLGFHFGARIEDPEGVLQGSGKQMRHIKIRSHEELGTPVIRDYLRRASPEDAVRSKTLATKIYPSKRTPVAGKRATAILSKDAAAEKAPLKAKRREAANKSAPATQAGRECYHCKQWIEPGEQHDCWTTTEAALTASLTEDLRDAWERIRETAVEFGEQRIYASGHAIMFARNACYFFVRPKKQYLEVCIFLRRKVQAPQVRRVEPTSKTKMAHMLRITHRDQVEAPMTDWLREAYGVSESLSKGS